MSTRFLGFDCTPVRLEDRRTLEELLHRHPQRLSGYTFASLAAWNETFRYGWHQPDPDGVIVSCIVDPDRNRHLLQPVGAVSEKSQEQIVREGRALPYALRMVGVAEGFLKAHPGFAQQFEVAEDRGNANYLYSAEELATLAGRKFSPKRNLIAQAEKAYAWTFEEVSAASAPECAALVRQIRAETADQPTPSLVQDMLAIDFVLRDVAAVGLRGYLIRVEGRVAAFCLWEPIAPGVAVVHFERALRSYKGLYQVLNRDVARALLAQGFALINREEDLGDPGLRQAKLSYNPVEIVMAYTMTLRPS
jgi:uncharacterized protein